MENRKIQKGFMSLGMMYLVLSLGFFLLCGFKIVPVYIDDTFVKSALTELGRDPNLNELSSREIKKKMRKIFQVNGIRGEIPEALKITSLGKGKLITIDYESRIPVLANIEVVISFQNHLDTSNPTECCKPVSE